MLVHAVYLEWSAQIREVIRSGIQPTHLDSHHHIHTLPQLYPVIRALQKDFGIRRVRRGKNVYAFDSCYNYCVLAWRVACHLGLMVGTNGIATDAFTDLPTFLSAHSRLKEKIRSLEIMVHPGHPDHHEDDVLLASQQWRSMAVKHHLIGYDQLR